MAKRNAPPQNEERHERAEKRLRTSAPDNHRTSTAISDRTTDTQKTNAETRKRSLSERNQKLYESPARRWKTLESDIPQNSIAVLAEAYAAQDTDASAAHNPDTANQIGSVSPSNMSKKIAQPLKHNSKCVHNVPGLDDFFGPRYLSTIGKAIIGNEAEGGLSRKDVRTLGTCSRSLRQSIYDKRNIGITLQGSLCDEPIIEPMEKDGRIRYCEFSKGLRGRLYRCRGHDLGLDTALKDGHGCDYWICEACADQSEADFPILDSIPFVSLCKECSLIYNIDYLFHSFPDLGQECNCDTTLFRTPVLCSECQLRLSVELTSECVNNISKVGLPALAPADFDIKTMTFSTSSTGIGLREYKSSCRCGKSYGEKLYTFWDDKKHRFERKSQAKVCLRCLRPKRWPWADLTQ